MRLRRLSRLLFLKGDAETSEHYSFPSLPADEEPSKCRLLVGDFPSYLAGSVKQEVEPLTKLAAKLLDTPHAVAVIFDDECIHTFAPYNYVTSSFPKLHTICAWHLVPCKPEILVLQDTTRDGRFRQAPFTCSGVRFYVGAPIVTSDARVLGSLCVVDVKPRPFDAGGCAFLSNVTDMVADTLDMITLDRPVGGKIICDVQDDWNILFGDKRFLEATGVKYGRTLWDDFTMVGLKDTSALLMQNSFKIALTIKDSESTGSEIFTASFWKATSPPKSRKIPYCSATDVTNLSHIYFASFERHRSTISSSTKQQPLTRLSDSPPFEQAVIHGLLGRGSFGIVYHGLFEGEKVAFKVFEGDSAGGIPLEALVGQDAISAGHPNIVRTLRCTVKKSDGWKEAWLVMEMCSNGSLLRWIDKGYFRSEASFYDGGPDMSLVVDAALQIANGIKCLHDSDILHGDLNCNNILVTEDFVFKLSDFGLSRVHCGNDYEADDAAHGTISHMPRELIVDKLISKSIDIYSFGVIMYELFTSRRAYAGMRYPTIYTQKILNRPLEFPMQSPHDYRCLAESCMSQERSMRPSIDRIIDDLTAIQKSISPTCGTELKFKVYE